MWRYYNHALIPDCAPHENVDASEVGKRGFWKKREGHPFLARWTTDFDSPVETDWWYVICDRPFDLGAINSKKRNVVKNGLKYCDSFVCDPLEYEAGLFDVFNEAQSSYRKNSRVSLTREEFRQYLQKLRTDESLVFYVSVLRESGLVVGYSIVETHEKYCELRSQKARPDYERFQVNASLVYSVLEDLKDRFGDGFYIFDGARNVIHETRFQDYLEKYFGFRKAYCRLHIKYRRGFGMLVGILYPFRKLFAKTDGSRLFCYLNGVMRMEEIVRTGK